MPKVYGVQFDIVWEDKRANHTLVESVLDDVSPEPGSLVVLPEMFDVGFSLNADRMADEVTDGLSESWCGGTARRYEVYLQGASIRFPDGASEKATNNAVVFNPGGECVCRYEKIYPFSGGREPERYRGGRSVVAFDWQGITVSPVICYDLRFPELWRLATIDRGAEMFTCGANWPAARQHHWETLLTARAIENQAFVIGVNRCGNDPHLPYAGGSRIIEPLGTTLDTAGESPKVISAEIDIQIARDWRAKFGAVRDVRREMLGMSTRINHEPRE